MSEEVLSLLQQLHEENMAILTTTFTSAQSKESASIFTDLWNLKMMEAKYKSKLAEKEKQ